MHLPEVEVYGVNELEALPWPDNEWSRMVKNVIPEYMRKGTSAFFDNVQTQMHVLLVDDIPLPIAICEPSQENSYVCSPYCYFISYGLDEAATFSNPFLRYFLTGFLKVLGKCFNALHIDKNVMLNNWLVPTNLHPPLTEAQLQAVTKKLVSLYPDRAIIIRSVNPRYPRELFPFLQRQDYTFVLSREIYFTDGSEEKPFKSRMFKSDRKILEKSSHRKVDDVEWLEDKASRIAKLYQALNIEKYSTCNPQYNDQFIRLAVQSGWMSFEAFEKDGTLDAVFGYFSAGKVMTSPLFGYDTSQHEDTGLYRLISTQLLLNARKQQKILHQSSGAGHYKKLRRAESEWEYMAVYDRHLGWGRRALWRSLAWLMDKVGRQFMQGR